jgi:hypothetical protein
VVVLVLDEVVVVDVGGRVDGGSVVGLVVGFVGGAVGSGVSATAVSSSGAGRFAGVTKRGPYCVIVLAVKSTFVLYPSTGDGVPCRSKCVWAL